MRDVIFIVGAGRSGSSALTRVLSLCGGALPLRLLEANSANPRGYWEPELAVALNERILQANGSSFFDPELTLQREGLSAATRAELIEGAALLLAEEFEEDGPLLVKDPRISGLLPYWIDAARRLGLRATCVHIFRHPADVAASIMRRDDLDVSHANALWLKYDLIAERDARAIPRLFVSYEDLLDDWESVVIRCARELGLELSIDDAARAAVARFLTRTLQHHASTWNGAANGIVDPVVAETYELLQAARRDPPVERAFDALLARYPRVPPEVVRAPWWCASPVASGGRL